ncbi:hypothetical protein [Halalkalibacter akibai]|uniref:Uncharacterized protein n=1 Tax=Halalkalibacter akibai (strain ATCC 43226 / DSM 21942 / CIP 109018 / JCM 9157 / 1139) TaxID=1236973 RepID=W4QPA2_HALA3|nr:hypothetical protein [Halalkalibacter akibai]GAE33483.1 hypothetical protein JCM9157_486 [Halalkalibacter akibai JCM 9157]
MGRERKTEAIFWSIAFPGFGQFLNKKYGKGLVFIILEIIVNVQARLNAAIIPSFYGQGHVANEIVNYQWIMFYPCIYLFSMWDAYRDAGGKDVRYAAIPFAISAYCGTVGVIYSHSVSISGHILGVIWLPILFHIGGYLIGIVVRAIILKVSPVDPQT